MFFVYDMEKRITLHPSYFNSNMKQVAINRLYEEVEGTNTGTMMILRIIQIKDASEPKVEPGSGSALYTIAYQAVVWQPFRGEVVDGEVSQVVNNGFFVDVGALSVFVSKAVSTAWEVPAEAMWQDCSYALADDSGSFQVYGRRLDAVVRGQRGPGDRGADSGAITHQGYPLRAGPDVRDRQHTGRLPWVCFIDRAHDSVPTNTIAARSCSSASFALSACAKLCTTTKFDTSARRWEASGAGGQNVLFMHVTIPTNQRETTRRIRAVRSPRCPIRESKNTSVPWV